MLPGKDPEVHLFCIFVDLFSDLDFGIDFGRFGFHFFGGGVTLGVFSHNLAHVLHPLFKVRCKVVVSVNFDAVCFLLGFCCCRFVFSAVQKEENN